MAEFNLSIVQNLGILALLTVGVAVWRPYTDQLDMSWARGSAIGVLLGGAALVVMHVPVTIPEGGSFDVRAAPAVLAAIVGGPIAAVVMAVIGAIGRLHVGGPMAIGGAVSFALYALAGLAARAALRRYGWRDTPLTYGLIGAFATVCSLPSFFVSADWTLGTTILAKVGPGLLLANVVGTMVLGSMFGYVQRRQELLSTLADREAEASKLALVASRTTNAVIITDANGLIEWVNDGFTRITGYATEEAVGVKPGDLLQGPDTDASTVALMHDAVAAGRGFETEVINYAKDGRPYWIQIDAQPIHEDGCLSRYIAVQTDVTEEVAARQRLEASEARLRTLMDAIPAEIDYTDAHGRVTYANLACRRAANISKEGQAPYHWRDAWQGQVPAQVEAAMQRALAGERATYTDVWAPDGAAASERTFDATLVPDLGTNGSVRGVFGIAFDVTDYRERAAELARARDQADAANRAKSVFLANMSHELRTPLNAINGYAEVMAGEMFGRLGNDRYVGYSQDILASGRYLLELIESVLDLSSIEAGQVEVAPTEISVADEVAAAARLLEHKARARKITIETDIGPDLTVRCDPRILKQILINCVDNAIKYSPEGTGVTVTAQAIGDLWRLTIRDRGHGIPEAEIGRIKEPFYRGESLYRDLASIPQGSGIGLSLVDRYASAMGGELTVESREGHGTAVFLDIPVDVQPAAVHCSRNVA